VQHRPNSKIHSNYLAPRFNRKPGLNSSPGCPDSVHPGSGFRALSWSLHFHSCGSSGSYWRRNRLAGVMHSSMGGGSPPIWRYGTLTFYFFLTSFTLPDCLPSRVIHLPVMVFPSAAISSSCFASEVVFAEYMVWVQWVETLFPFRVPTECQTPPLPAEP